MASNIGLNLKGYDHDFVKPPPDDLLCLICLSVARDPQQVNCCGKLMCKTCLEEHKRNSKHCPQCRSMYWKGIFSFTDKISERHILSLRVKCDNSPHGCEWTGELSCLKFHMTTCGFTLLTCPNECKDGQEETVKLLHKDIEIHKNEVCPRRQYECPHCQESGEYQERTTTHLEECPNVKVPCPNDGCEEKVERSKVPQHHQKCLYEKVSCIYTNIGCTKEVLRKDLKEHQNDKMQHLQVAIDTVHKQERTIKKHEDKIAQLHSALGPMKFTITNFNKLKTSSESYYSPAFYTSPGGYKMCINIDCNGWDDGKGTHVSVYAYLMRGENDDHLPWPFTGTVTFVLLNQLEDHNHHSRETTFTPDDKAIGKRVSNTERSSRGYGHPLYIRHSDLGYNAAKNHQYLKDDCLYFKIKVDSKSASKPWLV